MATNNTAFSPNADLVAQLSGSGNLVPGTVAATYATNTDITAILQYSRFVQITTTNAVGNSTVIFTGTAPRGLLIVEITNDAVQAETVTFGAGFRPTATVVGTNSKTISVAFFGNGTKFVEFARSASAIT